MEFFNKEAKLLSKFKNTSIAYYRDSRNANVFQSLVLYRTKDRRTSIIEHISIKADYLTESESKELLLNKMIKKYGINTN